MARAKQHYLLQLSLLAFALWLLPAQAQAVVLDWDTVNWSSGSLSQSFDIDASNPGNDITITISGDTGYLAQNVNDVTNLTGGTSPAQEALFMNMNYSDEDQEIYVTVTFHYAYGVENVSFSIFDIDEDDSNDSNVGYTDKIYLLGKNLKGKWVAPSDIDDYSANEQQSSGTNIYVRGNNGASDTTSAGNADYEFTGTNVINSFSFSYGNDANSPNNPGNQWIALHDIKYTPKIPEWHPGLIASFACLMLVGARRFFF